jgi:hypothetical protein
MPGLCWIRDPIGNDDFVVLVTSQAHAQHRWPNSYFAAAGLYSLKQAHAVACRSS